MRKLKDKIVVITGSTAGVGRATAVEAGKHGAKVVLLARGLESLESTKQQITDAGGKAWYFPTDVSDSGQVFDAAQKIEAEIGPIDIWINNAMNSVFAKFQDIHPSEFKRVTEVTYLGQVYGTMAALKYMAPRNKGKIVLVGSALAYRGIPLQSAYCGAKHGIQGFFDSLRSELIHDKKNIGLSMVQLPALNTPQFDWVLSRLPGKPRPMGKIYQPEVAARGILHAATHNTREIYVAYPTFQSIIGNKLFPGFLDKFLAKNAVDGQQTEERETPGRPNNVWEPLAGPHKMHGRFDKKATYKSPMLWLATHWHRIWFAVLLLAVIFLFVRFILI